MTRSAPGPTSGHISGNANSSSKDDGAYTNKRVLHACSSLIGAQVSLETEDGEIFEGLFRIFSPKLEITLEQVHLVAPEDPLTINPDTVQETVVFPMEKVVRCTAIDVDLNHAKDGFRTDAQIGAGSGGSGTRTNGDNLRELEEWVPEPGDHHGNALELDSTSGEANGWRPEDMFKANEENYGVTSTFKSNLEGYTLQITSDKNSEEYR
jgi:hypothetical protein